MKLQSVTDQVLHVVVGFAILLAFAKGGIAGGAAAGLGCGLIRELTEAGGSRIKLGEIGPHFSKRGPWIDLAFWMLGGLLAAILTQ